MAKIERHIYCLVRCVLNWNRSSLLMLGQIWESVTLPKGTFPKSGLFFVYLQKHPYYNITSTMLFGGMDPAFRKKGFGLCILEQGSDPYFKLFKDYVHFISWTINDSPEKAFWVIENSNLTNATYSKYGNGKQASRSVGKNQAASQICVDFFRVQYGKDYVKDISPKEKGKAWTVAWAKTVARQEGHKITNINQDQAVAYQLALRAKKEYMFASRRLALK